MEKIQRKQGQGFIGVFNHFETLVGRDVEIKIVNVQSDKAILTIGVDDINITDNVAEFEVLDLQTLNWAGDYKIQLFIDGETNTTDIVLLSPIVLCYSKKY